MTKIDTKKIANDFTKLNTLEETTAKTFASNLPFYLEIKNNMDFRALELAKYDDKKYLAKNKLKNKQVATQLFDDSIGYRKIVTTKKDGSLTLHFDVAIPLTADNQQAKVFMREIVRTEQSTPEVTEAVA